MVLSLIFIVLLFNISVESTKFRCDYKYTELGWFKYHVIPATFHDARLRCHYEGGMLASPTTDEIQSLMKHSVRHIDIFTGINAILSSGNYYSLDGIPLDSMSLQWANDEPDNKKNEERCISLNHEGNISDVSCDEPRPYICYRKHTYKNTNVCGTTDSEYRYEDQTKKCYKFHPYPRTFYQAHFICAAEGGHLAIINSDQESRVIKDLFAQYPGEKIVGSFFKDGAYLGFHNLNEGMGWTTLEGQSIQEAGFAKFDRGQPDNASRKDKNRQECGAVFRNGFLDDASCNEEATFICEKSADYPPVCDSEKTGMKEQSCYTRL